MLILGVILDYNSSSRTANVEVNGRIVSAVNYIYPSDVISTNIVNKFLTAEEKDTIIPSYHFYNGEEVLLTDDALGNLFILGKIIGDGRATTTTTTTQPQNIYKLGKFIIHRTYATDLNGYVEIPLFANRAYIRKINVIKVSGGDFTVKIYNNMDELQASWGDGEVILENELVDDAGLFFESYDYTVKFKFSKIDDYEIKVVGERFS